MDWNTVEGLAAVDSPSLLIDADAVQRNIERMVAIVDGDIARLRPHTKTHKMPAVARLQVAAGIEKFKAATIAEASMLASSGAKDVLLAHQPVGPRIGKLASLVTQYSEVTFAAVVDNPATAAALSEVFASTSESFRVFIDVDCGMHRTGIPFGDSLLQLKERIDRLPALEFAGLHVYDGHIHDAELEVRQQRTREIIEAVESCGLSLENHGVVGGGSPTFSIWADETRWDCSPGTTLLWDFGYGDAYPDLPFETAAALLSRVISKLDKDRVCLDLGHKSVAAEMPLPNRVRFPELHEVQLLGQSEEHLVIQSPDVRKLNVGDHVIGIPRHICPTVALHAQGVVVRDGRVSDDAWPVTARNR